jgi:hypothetical protein
MCGYRAARRAASLLAVAGINTRFSDHSSRRNETLFVIHDAQGRRCDGTPPLSETRLGICRRCCRVCCEREGRAAAADIGGTRPRATARPRCGTRGHHARRRRSAQARRGALGPRARASPRLAPWPPLGLAQASLGLASPPALWLAPASLGLASPPLAPSPPLLASPLLVRRFRVRAEVSPRPTWPETSASVRRTSTVLRETPDARRSG